MRNPNAIDWFLPLFLFAGAFLLGRLYEVIRQFGRRLDEQDRRAAQREES